MKFEAVVTIVAGLLSPPSLAQNVSTFYNPVISVSELILPSLDFLQQLLTYNSHVGISSGSHMHFRARAGQYFLLHLFQFHYLSRSTYLRLARYRELEASFQCVKQT